MNENEIRKEVANLIKNKEIIVAGSGQIEAASTEVATEAIVANATRRQRAIDNLNESDHVKAARKIQQLDTARNEKTAVFTGNKVTK